MNSIQFLSEQLQQSRAFLNETLSGIEKTGAHTPVPGACNPIDATYAHLVTGEDGFVNGIIRGTTPLMATTWSGKTGLSAMPPQGPAWSEWARDVQVDMDALRRYAAAVGDSTDAYVASLTPEDLDRRIDLTAFGLGERTLGWVLGAGVLGHVTSHWGEICALAGLQNRKGFPF